MSCVFISRSSSWEYLFASVELHTSRPSYARKLGSVNVYVQPQRAKEAGTRRCTRRDSSAPLCMHTLSRLRPLHGKVELVGVALLSLAAQAAQRLLLLVEVISAQLVVLLLLQQTILPPRRPARNNTYFVAAAGKLMVAFSRASSCALTAVHALCVSCA